MSLETWKREYYPFPASDCDESDALAHSLLKWRGFRKENLERHGVEFGLPRWGDSCALCCVYQREDEDAHECARCPLFKSRGGVRCDNKAEGEGASPFAIYMFLGNPEPMIAALEKAREMEGNE